ncbi:MAG: hypothetical protein JO346_01000 [Alphaproteobacteria bacterium]|nr:hypothetical protein [Alphaproteobacteria bacterium]
MAVALLAGSTFAAPASSDGGGLKIGEYACGDALAYSFRVIDGRRYTDLDNTTTGTYEIRGDKVYFHGAHLDGLVGTGLKDHNFRLSDRFCGPWQ